MRLRHTAAWLLDTELMGEIVRYNGGNCKVKREIVWYLRTHH